MRVIKTMEKKMLLCPLLGAALSACLNILFATVKLDSFFPAYTTEVRPWLFRFPVYIGVLIYGVLTSLLEELIFRKLLFSKLCVYVTVPAAGIGSAIVFGIYHGNAVQFIYAFLFGMVLAFICWRFDSFIPCVMVHGAANIYVYVTYFTGLPGILGSIGVRIILILISGLVSFCILMYFLNTAPEKSIMPEKPFFPR